MAKIWQISDGRSYVVNGDPGTTITYTNSTSNGTAAGKQAASIPAGATSVTFPSNGAEVEISSDTATIDQVFNAAAAGSGSSSGGSGSAGGVTFQIVDTLPNQGAAGVIYLVKVSETGDDKFEEWIWVDSAWESIGTTAVDPTTYAKLIGGNTFEGDQVINGDLTVTGDVSGITESNYNVVETTETTITPTGGTWVRYTGSETVLTIEEPGWDGEAEISYLETATPVDLQGVTWSPAKPILTGNGPFVYTLVHAGDGQMLAGAYGYSVATAEAVQAVVPMAWTKFDTAPVITGLNSLAIGNGSRADNGVAIGIGAKAAVTGGVVVGFGSTTGDYGTVLGNGTAYTAAVAIAAGANANYNRAISIGYGSVSNAFSVVVGSGVTTSKPTTVTIGSQFIETVDGQNVTNYCKTEGTGSITIGAGANTLNTTTTVEGVETTVESSNSITIGCKASNTGADSVVIGAQASSLYFGGVAIGTQASADFQNAVSVGRQSRSANVATVSLGYAAQAVYHSDVAIGNNATASGNSSVAIGRQASVSASATNAIVLGTEASAAGADSIVMGAGSSGTVAGSVVIGSRASGSAGYAVGVGYGAEALGQFSLALGGIAKAQGGQSTAIGAHSYAPGTLAVAMGYSAQAKAEKTVSIGYSATVNDYGATVIRSTASDGTYTQLYFAGANTPLANTYEDGEAMMGYVVMQKGEDDQFAPVAAGTQKLSVLFPNNSGFQPATLGLDDEMTPPKVFHPSDLDLPVEEPTEEPEDVTTNTPEPVIPEPETYTPLPVYPIVEPENVEADILEQEPYTPLPVYPIVETEVPELAEM